MCRKWLQDLAKHSALRIKLSIFRDIGTKTEWQQAIRQGTLPTPRSGGKQCPGHVPLQAWESCYQRLVQSMWDKHKLTHRQHSVLGSHVTSKTHAPTRLSNPQSVTRLHTLQHR